MPDSERQERGLMTVLEVAIYTRLSESAVRKRVAAGTIPVVRIGRRTLFRPADIDAWISQQTQKGDAA
jgi:excisionase family DNA binding protein